ncbi:putative trans-2-enoyl-CoA reductase 1, mitochondrial [Tetrabaena socialis]|uniref:Putative trans-2-enoyl-CoA reductase 1, mitochondrial n=1 Tax=Tetrabaena socialis TaxID=47790 RepID=A0A2J8AE89_9CHLO|nr:putative trans-2-enoyl-CoA reductase 1, mitochondrial [Tetrabaena socialis]|eukprot:PNH10840.1 putative trans-2-enoyl-CoA reductase 1, mitochondrial [Tetrabaena socialis]
MPALTQALTQSAVQTCVFGLDGIAIAQVPIPEPASGEVLLRLLARPVNPADLFSALGVYPGFQPKAMPAILGLEAVGKVIKLGPNVSGRLKEGQRVVAAEWQGTAVGNGTWQQYVSVPEEDLVPVPDDLPDEAACQALINPVTVVGMFTELATPKGDWMIVTAAGSALGRQALSYAKHLGVHVIATCRRVEQVAELKEAGAQEVVVVSDEAGAKALAARAKELTKGRGAWGALDSIAGPSPLQLAPALRTGGNIILYGAMSSPTVDWHVSEGLFRLIVLKGFWVKEWLGAKPKEEQRAVMVSVLEMMRSGVLPPAKVDARPLEAAVEALKDLSVVGRPAKVVLLG